MADTFAVNPELQAFYNALSNDLANPNTGGGVGMLSPGIADLYKAADGVSKANANLSALSSSAGVTAPTTPAPQSWMDRAGAGVNNFMNRLETDPTARAGFQNTLGQIAQAVDPKGFGGRMGTAASQMGQNYLAKKAFADALSRGVTLGVSPSNFLMALPKLTY